MKNMITTTIVMVTAATAGRIDHSGLFVRLFLGFCALIVMA